MSFSSEVKEELSRKYSKARHCQLAELAAIISMCGQVMISGSSSYRMKLQTENLPVARKAFTLMQELFNIKIEVSVCSHERGAGRRIYAVLVGDHKDALCVLKAVKLLDRHMEIMETMSITDNLLLQRTCCKRAFIRGAFLSSGSLSDPQKSYHFEIVCTCMAKASQLAQIMNSFEMDAKIVCRKKYFVVYLKEGSQIVDLLNIMEAHNALMNLENVRILKEMRNSVNRKVNCETANIHKTVSAAVKQIEDIEYLKNRIGFEGLSENLKEIATLRLANPDASLKELGQMLVPPVGKSGINHRLRKLCNLAEELRGSKEEKHYD